MQLELEAQEQQEVTDEVEQGTEEEINRLKETLAATSHEMEHIKEDYADRADKLQYAEQLLEKAKADFRDKNSRIKALEAQKFQAYLQDIEFHLEIRPNVTDKDTLYLL